MEALTLDFTRTRLPLFAHQKEDVQRLLEHPYFFIASEMRTGKSAIVVVAAQFLFEAHTIDRVVVVAPAPVRDVWADEELGEIAKHAFLPSVTVTEFHSRIRSWARGTTTGRRLDWYVTNFEFLRSKQRFAQLLPVCTPRTLLVVDESSFVKNYAAQQTKACVQLRKACGRVVLLNGTPIFHNPLDLFSQGNLLHPGILQCQYITHFKSRYAIQSPVMKYGGKPLLDKWNRPILTVERFVNLDDLQRRFAPYTVRRLQSECLDLPPKLDPVTLTATFEPATWRAYKDMRDELVVWLKSGQVVTSATAAIKALRLSQITSGFLSGAEEANIDADVLDVELPRPFTHEVGREKLDVLLWFLEQRLEADPGLHVVAWCRFRAELFRIADEVQKKFPQFEVAAIHGGQKRAERLRALSLLKPETSPTGPVFVVGIEGTGSFGLDMTASHTCVTMSSGYSPGRSAQTLDRVYGPAQKFPIAYFDIVAVGPSGQRTIDHDILRARRAGEDVAQRTASAWVKALTEE